MRSIGMMAILIAIASSGICSPARAADDLCSQMANTAFTLPQPATLEGAATHVYKSVGGHDLRVHVFSPSSADRALPAVVFFYGGGWMIGTVNEMAAQAKYIASRGAAGIVVEYREHCRYGVSVADEIADAKAAVGWVRQHAGQLNLDPDRIAVVGGSSGGHLALSTAVFAEAGRRARPDLLVLFYPCTDLTTKEEMSYGAKAIGDRGREFSPTFHLSKGLPRMIVFQGTADPLYAQNREYCRKVRAQGDACEFVEYADAPHGFFNKAPKNAQWYERGLREMDGFLVKAGYLPPQPSR